MSHELPALGTRALRLAQGEYPDLSVVAFDEGAEGGLRGIGEFAATRAPDEVGDALAAILAHFIGLLTVFIGEELGLRLIRESAPESGGNPAGAAATEAEE